MFYSKTVTDCNVEYPGDVNLVGVDVHRRPLAADRRRLFTAYSPLVTPG